MTTVDERNRATSAQEVADFKTDPPERYFAYHSGGTLSHVGHDIVTWMGDNLAHVTERFPVYRSNFGDRRQRFRAVGINGCTYSGTAYLDAGDYVRIRKVKA